MKNRVLPLIGIACLSFFSPALSEGSFGAKYLDDRVSSLTVSVSTQEYRSFPYFIPSQGEELTFSFDILDDRQTPLYYRLEHYDAEWRESDLWDTEAWQGLSSGTLSSPKPSTATKVTYWHYSLTLGKDSPCRPVASGNWRIFFFESGKEDTPVLEVSFALVEPWCTIEADISENTQLGAYTAYQQVSARLLSSPQESDFINAEVKLFVGQNGRSDNTRLLTTPSFQDATEIRFDRSESATFEAGSEYFSFEILGELHANMGVEELDPYGEISSARLFRTGNSSSRVYENRQDADGRVVYRSPEGSLSADTAADYYLVTFSFASDPLLYAPLLSGEAFDPLPLEERKLIYNDLSGTYERTLLLKAGYYSYQILTSGSSEALTATLTMGNHYQTSNTYTLFAYYRGFMDKYDRLVGVKQIAKR